VAALSITEHLHLSLTLKEQESVLTNSEQVAEYETLLGIKIPQWYIAFLEQFGYVQCWMDSGSVIDIFDINESKGFYQDRYDKLHDDVDQRLPMGTDTGGRALFYSERDGEHGMYVTYIYPDPDYFIFLASNIESFLFDGVGLKKFAKM